MNIHLSGDRLNDLSVYPSIYYDLRISTYEPHIESSHRDQIIFGGRPLSLESELVASIIENVFRKPFDDSDGGSLDFVAKVLNYKNTKLHHWGLRSQKLSAPEGENSLIGFHGSSVPIPWFDVFSSCCVSHMTLNLIDPDIKDDGYSPLTLSKLGYTKDIVFASTRELNKIYHKRYPFFARHFDSAQNISSYVHLFSKGKVTRF